MAMQMQEVHQREAHIQFNTQLANRRARLVDPLWGEYAVPSGEPHPVVRCGFGFCPCIFVGSKRSWKHFLVSWSVFSAVLQCAVLSLCIVSHGGFVSMESNPMWGPHYYTLDIFGAKNVARIMLKHEWWRLATPMVLHTGVLHLLGNLLVQLRTGSQLEYIWGHFVYIFIYIVSGVYATLCSCVMLPGGLSVGSSGALCGLIGAWLAFTLITWNQTLPHDIPERDQQVVSIAFSILLIAGMSFLPMMDYGAHLGGLAAGAALAMVVFAGRLQDGRYKIATRTIGLVLSAVLFVAVVVWLLEFTPVDERLLNLCGPDTPGC